MDYKLAFIISFIISFVGTLICRFIAKKFLIFDHPISDIKTHKEPVPYLGGLAIAGAFFITLVLVRFTTSFPTGTLRALRGIVFAGAIVVLLGLIDDIKFKGLHFTTKFIAEIIVGTILIFYGIKIEFISPEWLGILITLLWVIGMTNALNIIDVVDGLSSGVAIISSFFFFLIGSSIEEDIYVNYTSIVLAGSCLGFLPYNLSKKYKIFMGDTGSLFIGFVLSAIALGTRYSQINPICVIVPIIILLIPIYDTLLVSILRLKQGKSPFLGSKDHFALRLEFAGFNRKTILLISYFANILLGIIGYLITRVNLFFSLTLLTFLLIVIIIISSWLSKIKIE